MERREGNGGISQAVFSSAARRCNHALVQPRWAHERQREGGGGLCGKGRG